jgi:hypothetical protein
MAPLEPQASGGQDTSVRERQRGRLTRWAGPLMAAVSLLVTFGVLEGLATLYVGRKAPTRLRDGIYLNQLPLITGQTPPSFRGARYPGAKLPEHKAPGELRVAVVGESSVEGSPFSHHGSPATMLHDLLVEVSPERPVTVINMGRVSSIAANAYYYLLFLKRYQPDVIVLYMGFNDGPYLGGEQCWAATHPRLHAAWRAAARHSWLLWAVRAFVPPHMARLSGAPEYSLEATPEPCAALASAAWTDWLVEAAADTGARVIVTTPVHNPLVQIEPGLPDALTEGLDLARLAPDYRALLACRLTPGCDVPGRAARALDVPYAGGSQPFPEPAVEGFDAQDLNTPRARHRAEHDLVSFAWRRAARAHGARVVDFRAAIEASRAQAPLGLGFFLDEIHLSLTGYHYLASHWREAILDQLGLRSPPPRLPTDAELRPYRDDLTYLSTKVALNFLCRGWLVSPVPMLELATRLCPRDACDEAAPLALAWLRLGLGLPPGVTGQELEAARAFEPLDWLR